MDDYSRLILDIGIRLGLIDTWQMQFLCNLYLCYVIYLSNVRHLYQGKINAAKKCYAYVRFQLHPPSYAQISYGSPYSV
jgi:hypothetical protein